MVVRVVCWRKFRKGEVFVAEGVSAVGVFEAVGVCGGGIGDGGLAIGVDLGRSGTENWNSLSFLRWWTSPPKFA